MIFSVIVVTILGVAMVLTPEGSGFYNIIFALTINQQLDIMGEEVKAATGRVKVYTNECMSELARNMRLQLV